MKRAEHLEWAKERAYKHLEIDESMVTWTSFCNDLRKHEELEDHLAIDMGSMMMMISGLWNTKEDCKKFIEGFN